MKTLIKKTVAELTGYTPGEQPQIAGLIKLNTNENPYPPSPKVAAVLKEFAAEDLRRYPDPVSLALRRRIAEVHGCAVEQVFVGNGSDEILALSTRAFVEDDGAIGFFQPSYSLYPVLAAMRAVRAAPVELPADFRWRRPEALDGSLFFLANPNAPTGALFPRREVEDFCRQYAGVVLMDEAYVDFARENCLALAKELPNVLVMRTLSKSYSLAGIRIGYVLGAAELIAALGRLKDSYNLDALAQRIGLAALSDLAHMRKNVARIQVTRERLAAALPALGYEVFPSETNFLWVRPRAAAADVFQHLRNQAILVRHFAGPRTGDYLRITIGTDEEIDRLLEVLALLQGERTTIKFGYQK